jgi:hypothetical protein
VDEQSLSGEGGSSQAGTFLSSCGLSMWLLGISYGGHACYMVAGFWHSKSFRLKPQGSYASSSYIPESCFLSHSLDGAIKAGPLQGDRN